MNKYIGATILDIEDHRWFCHLRLKLQDGTQESITFAGGEEWSGLFFGTRADYEEAVD